MTAALFLHCAIAHSGVWSGLLSALSSIKTHPPDLPGHGSAPDWDGGDYQVQARDIAIATLDGPADVVGHSYGATVALRLAMDRPDLVQSLTLIEPVFFAAARHADPKTFARYQAQFQPFETAMNAGDMAKASMAFTDMWGGDSTWLATGRMQQDYITARISLIPATAPAILDDNADMWDALPRITMPSLLIEGSQSPFITASIQQALAERLTNANRQAVSGAGHMVPISHPKEVANLICNFLSL